MALPSDITLPSLLLLIAVFVLGGTVKGALGFGLPLTTMAILPLFMPVETALTINAMILPFTNITQLLRGRRVAETFRRFRFVVAGVVVGVPIGAVFIAVVDDHVLMLALGIFVLLFIAVNVLNPRLVVPATREREFGLLTGVLAGTVGALTTANGPVFVMYLLGLKVDRALFVSALGLLFITSGLLITGSFLLTGVMDPHRFLLLPFCVPAALVGMRFGNYAGHRLPTQTFRVLVMAVLCVLGLNLIIQASLELRAGPQSEIHASAR